MATLALTPGKGGGALVSYDLLRDGWEGAVPKMHKAKGQKFFLNCVNIAIMDEKHLTIAFL